jgi:hypothetical protein
MPAGRPSLYSEEMAERICEGLSEGLSLIKICKADGMPHRATIMRWWEKNPEFATKCARARILQADLMDDMILDLIDQVTPESAPADRVKLAALTWRASKLAPKKYGNKLDLTHADPDGGAVTFVTVYESPKSGKVIRGD